MKSTIFSTNSLNLRMFTFLLLALAGLFANVALAQAPTAQTNDEALLDMSLEELLDVEIDVVSKSDHQSQNMREVPGIVTIINRDQILRMGAKDLIEVLRQVPGFQIGGDSSNSYYMGIRGLWAFDGKVLVIIDGHEINELAYSSVNLGNRFPLDWIQRIEIIRGPGAVMYGGSAAYGVINIVTRSPEELKGTSAAASYSQMLDGVINDNQSVRDTFGQRYISASAGQLFSKEKNLGLTLDFFGSQGMMSDQTYTDIYGDSFNMAGNSETGAMTGKLSFTYRGLKIGYFVERYHLTTRDGWGVNMTQAFPAYFTTSSLNLSYDIPLGAHATLTPKISHLFEKPWEITDEAAKPEVLYWEPVIHRLRPGLTLQVTPANWLHLTVAAEYRYDHIKDDYYGFMPDICELDDNLNSDPSTCKTTESFHNFAAYGEGVIYTRPFNISAGVRYEYNSVTGGEAVPRASLTKSFDRFHFKLLASQAFREPSINNLSYNPDLKRDKTTVGEAEAGIKIMDSLFWTVNGYLIYVKDPIVYYYDEATETESFINYKQTGTTGFETELSFKHNRHFARLGYSNYFPVFNEVESYSVPGHGNSLLAFARHKLSLAGGIELVRDLSLNFTGSLLFGKRYGFVAVDDDGNSQLKKFAPEFVANLNLLYRNVFAEGLSISLGARNIANREIQYIQPYDNWHAPSPGAGAEVFLKVGYDFSLQ